MSSTKKKRHILEDDDFSDEEEKPKKPAIKKPAMGAKLLPDLAKKAVAKVTKTTTADKDNDNKEPEPQALPSTGSKRELKGAAEDKIFNAKKTVEDLQSSELRIKLSTLSALSAMKNVNVIPKEVVAELRNLLRVRSFNFLMLQIAEKKLLVLSVLSTLTHFSTFERTKLMLGEIGVIPTLIPYLNNTEEVIRSRTLDVLINIATNVKNQVRLVDWKQAVPQDEKLSDPPQIMFALVGLVQREIGPIQDKAFQLLDTMLHSAACLEVICQEDTYMQGLITLLEHQNAAVRLWAIKEFEYMIINHTAQARHFAEFNCVEPIVQLIPSQECQLFAIRSLARISELRDQFRLYVGEAGGMRLFACNNYFLGIEHLLDLLTSIMETTKQKTAAELLQEQERLAKQLANKSTVPDAPSTAPADAKTEEDPLQILLMATVRLIADVTDEISGKESGALIENKERFVNANGIRVLMKLLGSNRIADDAFGEQIRELTVRIIGNISVQENTLKVLEGGVISVLLDMLAENPSDSQRQVTSRKQHVVRAMSSFAIYDECVNKLVELGVIDKLLDMVRTRMHCAATIADIFAQMNTHANFQRIIYNSGGIKDLIDLALNGRDEFGEKVAGLKSVAPFASTPNGRMVLQKENFVPVLKGIVEDFRVKKKEFKEKKEQAAKERAEREREKQLKAAKEAKYGVAANKFLKKDNINKFEGKKEEPAKASPFGKQNLKKVDPKADPKAAAKDAPKAPEPAAKKNADSDDESDEEEKLGEFTESEFVRLSRQLLRKIKKEHDVAARLQLHKAKPFEFNYDELDRIDRELVAATEKKILSVLELKQLKLQINWRFLERDLSDLKEGSESLIETKESIVRLFAREAMWNELVTAFEIIHRISGEKAGNILRSQIKMIVLDVTKEPQSAIHRDDMVLRYSIALNGNLASPKDLCGQISEHLLGEDITLFEDIEETDEQYEVAIQALRKTALDSRIAMIGDINILYFHLEMEADSLFKASFAENQAIVAAKSCIGQEELFLKAWPIIKLNKNGLKQERILVLTDIGYYTVNYDYSTKKIDFNHVKYHTFSDFYLIDVGPLRSRDELAQQQKDLERLKEAYMQLKQGVEPKAGSRFSMSKGVADPKAIFAQQPAADSKETKRNSLTAPVSPVPVGKFDEAGFAQWLHENEEVMSQLNDAFLGEKLFGMNIVTKEKAHKNVLGGSRKSQEYSGGLSLPSKGGKKDKDKDDDDDDDVAGGDGDGM